jgi:hypothetical protein
VILYPPYYDHYHQFMIIAGNTPLAFITSKIRIIIKILSKFISNVITTKSPSSFYPRHCCQFYPHYRPRHNKHCHQKGSPLTGFVTIAITIMYHRQSRHIKN